MKVKTKRKVLEQLFPDVYLNRGVYTFDIKVEDTVIFSGPCLGFTEDMVWSLFYEFVMTDIKDNFIDNKYY